MLPCCLGHQFGTRLGLDILNTQTKTVTPLLATLWHITSSPFIVEEK